MLRFDGKSHAEKPRNYLARPEQLRLLVLVGGLALVGWTATLLNSPAGTQAMAALLGQAADQEQAPQSSAITTLAEAQQWLTEPQRQAIQDNAPFRAAESPGWFAVLQALQQHPPEAALPAVPVTYAQLAAQAEVYRGKTVRVQGSLQRVEPQQPAQNELGLQRYYRVILRPAGREAWPLAVYTLVEPKSTEPGIAAAVSGVFFKNLSYQSPAGAGVMPVLLASQVEVSVPQTFDNTSQRSEPGIGDLGQLALVAAGLASVLVMWIALRGGGAR